MKIIQGIKLFDTEDLAEMFNMHICSIRNYLKEGRLKGKKIGKKWYVTEKNIKDFLTGDMEQGDFLTRNQVRKILEIEKKTG